MIHWLKTASSYFSQSWDGLKPYEIRREDDGRQFAEGDIVILADSCASVPEAHRAIVARVESLLRGFPGLEAGWVALGLTVLGHIDDGDVTLFVYQKWENTSEQWTGRHAIEEDRK